MHTEYKFYLRGKRVCKEEVKPIGRFDEEWKDVEKCGSVKKKMGMN